jgi:hypothetical protein
MRILYLGEDFRHSTSFHRAAALRRLGHEVTVVNPHKPIPQHWSIRAFNARTGYRLFIPMVHAYLKKRVHQSDGLRGKKHDLAWVDGGAEIAPGFYDWLKKNGTGRIINYNVDDPFGNRDRRKWDLYRRSVKKHDLTVVVREENIDEARHWGARSVLRVFRSYDPIEHQPEAVAPADEKTWGSAVAFVGTWMPERGSFLAELIRSGVPLTIWGDGWSRAQEYSVLRPCVRGNAVYGRDYVKAVQFSKVAIGLLSVGNRDLHTTRSAEIPFIGSTVFCAQKTRDHEIMFADGINAVLWSSAAECARKCLELLTDKAKADAIAAAGRARIQEMGLSNDAILQQVLSVNDKTQ